MAVQRALFCLDTNTGAATVVVAGRAGESDRARWPRRQGLTRALSKLRLYLYNSVDLKMDSDEEDLLLRGARPQPYLKRRKTTTTTKVVEDEYELAELCDIPDDPGVGKREKGSWYITSNSGARKWCGTQWSCPHGFSSASYCRKGCGGHSYCSHGQKRSRCRLCSGSEICQHDCIRSQCVKCGGSSICQHNVQRAKCKLCGGTSICSHNVLRASCKLCSGSSICIHGQYVRRCKTCNPCNNDFCSISGCFIRANYKDKEGKPNSLCFQHAVAEGTAICSHVGSSVVACSFFCSLRSETQGRLAFEHECCALGSWIGQEVRGLVSGRHPNFRPDGVMRDPVDNKVICVAEYHGNAYHGYPPGHPLHNSEVANRNGHKESAKELYEKTMAKMDAFAEAGYAVCYAWEHEHRAALREGAPLEEILHWHA